MIPKNINRTHNQRCPKCKEAIKNILEKIYGKVEANYKFNISPYPENLKDTPYYRQLKKIFEALQNYRGFMNFVKVKTLPRCDFFVPDPGFIVEFDESQHFTKPRRITLENYPDDIKLGFDKERWIKLCDEIDAKDNDPPYRDEQRAWYDTLRDFLPAIIRLKPTVRLFAKDCVWCSLDPNNSSDIETFKNILKGAQKMNWEIKVKEENNPSIARVIIAGDWKGNPTEAKQLLIDVYEKFPKDKKVKFLLTCGGFIQFDWPESVSQNDIGDNKYPNDKALSELVAKAKEYANIVLDEDLCNKLKEVTDYITLGIDSFKEKISTTKNYIGTLHIELVFLKDLKHNKLYWTGKSYPTHAQEKGLIRIADLKTHFFDLETIGKIMILGCHDLTIFNPRSKNAKNWRKEVNEKFKELAKKEKPVYVLHHPHTTVKSRTWLNAWSGLKNTLPSVKYYASAGRYYEPDRNPSKWDPLDDILKKTKSEKTNTIDFIYSSKIFL